MDKENNLKNEYTENKVISDKTENKPPKLFDFEIRQRKLLGYDEVITGPYPIVIDKNMKVVKNPRLRPDIPPLD